MLCRGCGLEAKLIDAHIVPQWVSRDLRSDESHLKVIKKGDERASRSWTGIYDKTILCRSCDQYLGTFDEYGKKVLLGDQFPRVPISRKGIVAGWDIKGVDVTRFQKFLLSILWRASISSHDVYKAMKLGPHEEVLRDYLWSEDLSHPNFGVVLGKFESSTLVPNLEKTIAAPGRTKKIYGVNFCRYHIAGYAVMIRVDKRKASSELTRVELSPSNPITLLSQRFDGSTVFKDIWASV